MKVLVTHPGRQHSHQAALALAEGGALAGYWSGVPALPVHFARVPPWLAKRYLRYSPVPLPGEGVRWHPATPLLRRAGDALLPRPLAAWVDYLACRRFDRWVARGLRALAGKPGARPDAVIACEISAVSTFRLARGLGILALLDAPSIHHQAQDRLHGFTEPASLHRRIVAVKDAEIELADHILTVSELARATYLEEGALPEAVHAVMLGADLTLFGPAGERSSGGASFVLVFPGAMIRRKGFDLLVSAFSRLRRHHSDVELWVAGPAGDASAALEEAPTEGIRLLGRLPQSELAQVFRRADCVVLPSRNDSYGMVVAEALAAGRPVIVSEMVGSKELVRPGQNGWVVPVGDAEALYRQLEWCATHRHEVRSLAAACRASAAEASWEGYRGRFTRMIAGLVEAHADARRN